MVMQLADSDISEQECWQLLATAGVGRIALSIRALPAILPIQYYLEGKIIAICLGHHAIGEDKTDGAGAVVAFAADDMDPERYLGWSVQVQGRLHLPRTPGVQKNCGQPTAGQFVHLDPAWISGHRIRLCPLISPS